MSLFETVAKSLGRGDQPGRLIGGRPWQSTLIVVRIDFGSSFWLTTPCLPEAPSRRSHHDKWRGWRRCVNVHSRPRDGRRPSGAILGGSRALRADCDHQLGRRGPGVKMFSPGPAPVLRPGGPTGLNWSCGTTVVIVDRPVTVLSPRGSPGLTQGVIRQATPHVSLGGLTGLERGWDTSEIIYPDGSCLKSQSPPPQARNQDAIRWATSPFMHRGGSRGSTRKSDSTGDLCPAGSCCKCRRSPGSLNQGVVSWATSPFEPRSLGPSTVLMWGPGLFEHRPRVRSKDELGTGPSRFDAERKALG